MKVIAVDDEQILLDDFTEMLQSMPEVSSVKGFTNCEKALKYIGENDVDVAFLDVRMRGMDGMTLAKRAKVLKPSINIIFLTAYPEYSLDAMHIHASGYLVKPALEEDVRKELRDLRVPPEVSNGQRLKVQCFGNFEIYVDSYPLPFKYIKTKELFAYLVDRKGAFCSNGEILGALWEDKEITISLENYLRNLVSDLRSVLKEYHLEDVMMKKKGMIRIVPELMDCDYYRWIEGDSAAINAFNGEYMSQYSWAESTLAGIESRNL
jgi:two-component SAPR family response regulator